jgi:hypothetical protein
MAWIKGLGLVLGGLAVLLVALNVLGAWRWAGRTQALLARLDGAQILSPPSRFDAGELEGLPQPVQRFLRAVLKDGQAIIVAAEVEHRGSFNMGQGTDEWKPFVSHQRVVMRRPGFVWDGEVALLPGLPVRVHDAYVAGEGILHPSVMGLFSLLHLQGEGDVARGELMRFFAEASWYPTALLPSQGVRWEAVDDHSARATLTDGALRLTLLFRFGEEGLIESVRAEARGRMVGKDIVMTPWEGRWSHYQERDGMRVPMSGEVAWLTPEGRKVYWRGTITSLRFEFSG